MRKFITEEQFREGDGNVTALRNYLNSPHGQAFIAALEGYHPLRKLSDTDTCASVVGIHAATVGRSVGDGVPHTERIIGYESLLMFIDSLVKPKKPPQKPKSKKAGGEGKPKPEPLPPT